MYDYGLTYKQKFTHESGAAVRSNASFSPACLGCAEKVPLVCAAAGDATAPADALFVLGHGRLHAAAQGNPAARLPRGGHRGHAPLGTLRFPCQNFSCLTCLRVWQRAQAGEEMRRQSLSDTSGADAATTAAAKAAAEAEAAAALGPQNGEEVVLVYRHAEGFTNAVRRPVKMTDMLDMLTG